MKNKIHKSQLSGYLLLTCVMMVSACSAHRMPNKQADTSVKNMKEVPLKQAAYSFPVEKIKQNGNKVSFTIPKDARMHDKKADAVTLSGLYATDQKQAVKCPVVDSHHVDKEVQSYQALSGKADVVATFDKASDAARAVKSGCLLIYDAD